jgi:hypothetical protein
MSESGFEYAREDRLTPRPYIAASATEVEPISFGPWQFWREDISGERWYRRSIQATAPPSEIEAECEIIDPCDIEADDEFELLSNADYLAAEAEVEAMEAEVEEMQHAAKERLASILAAREDFID